MLNSNISNESAQGFGEWLRESNYAFIYKTMAGIFNTVEPWIDEKIINEMLKDVTEIDRHITEFFLLGYAKDKKLLKKILGDRNLEFLCETGFASDVEGLIEPQGFVILPVDDLFLIVSLPSCYSNAKKRMSDIYIGSDSTKLMKYIKRDSYDSVLDLCAGSGVQGLNIIENAEKVVEVELNDVAYNAAILNGKINGISPKKYEVRKSNLYQMVPEQFDCIISNPPFVPVPENIVFPLCGDGGEDGLDLVRKIISGYTQHLKPFGKAYMVLECIGDEEGPYVVKCMKEILKSGSINVSLINRQQIEFQADACAFGMEACKQYYNTRYVRMPDLLMDLDIARTEGNYRKVMAKYSNPVLLILDEWMLLKPTDTEQKDIFELLHRRRKKSSTIFCSQYVFEEWHDQLGGEASPLADAIIDRIAHDSYQINITSIDAEHDKSMREVYGLDKTLRE